MKYELHLVYTILPSQLPSVMNSITSNMDRYKNCKIELKKIK